MQIEIKPVSYEDRRIEIGSELEFPVQKLRELKNHIPFIKPKKFKSEQEVRFAFWLVHNDRKISINDNAKIISLRPIDRFIGAFK
ncbi:hypothetical protein A8B76_08340 [Roseovarius indicus]|nr:hypothetical protein A8B76_08340 [Roseovarius indicus]